jgi:hypothetical protein
MQTNIQGPINSTATIPLPGRYGISRMELKMLMTCRLPETARLTLLIMMPLAVYTQVLVGDNAQFSK